MGALALATALNERVKFVATFMVSALNGDGVADLREWLAREVPPGPWHYPEDQVSDAPLRQLAAEVTREIPLVPAGASGRRASTKCTMLSVMSWSP